MGGRSRPPGAAPLDLAVRSGAIALGVRLSGTPGQRPARRRPRTGRRPRHPQPRRAAPWCDGIPRLADHRREVPAARRLRDLLEPRLPVAGALPPLADRHSRRRAGARGGRRLARHLAHARVPAVQRHRIVHPGNCRAVLGPGHPHRPGRALVGPRDRGSAVGSPAGGPGRGERPAGPGAVPPAAGAGRRRRGVVDRVRSMGRWNRRACRTSSARSPSSSQC
jgi:hypothetical protein